MNGPLNFSDACNDVLRLLSTRHNVLISGAPATGKSFLLSEIALAFAQAPPLTTESPTPVHVPGARVSIPASPLILPETSAIPSRDRTDRKVFRTAFHQGSKYRDFVSGLTPRTGVGETGFQVTAGTLFNASEHAKASGGASLLIIDEINRGPAIQVFGGSIVAIESDKRLAPDGSRRTQTLFFELLDPATGATIEYALPHHLYIVAAMNQADASVEPLDVAFLRRWAPYRLLPDTSVLRSYFQLAADLTEPPQTPLTAADVYEAAVQAWQSVNRRIRLGRGAEFEIGHGVLMDVAPKAPQDLDAALNAMAGAWDSIFAHIMEVFFGDTLAIAAALNANEAAGGPYRLSNVLFADEPRLQLDGPERVDATNVYGILRAVAE